MINHLDLLFEFERKFEVTGMHEVDDYYFSFFLASTR